MAAVDRKRRVSSFDEMPQEHRELLEEIRRRMDKEMEPIHKQYRGKWDHYNALYHNFDDLRSKWQEASSGSSARGVLLDAKRDWGGHLVIPYGFATVETVVPRVLAARPRFVAKALQSESMPVLDAIQDAVNQQFADIDLELKLNPTVRRACKTGLGVQMTYWEETTRTVVQWGQNEAGEQVPVKQKVLDRRGPQVEDVDPYDWFWDPTAKSIESCEDIIYRTWRPFSYIEEKVKRGREMREAGKTGGWFDIDLDAAKGMASPNKRHELWEGRLGAQGIDASPEMKEGHIHEVWQYFKGDRIVTVLNRELVVADDVSPFFHREFPFQIFRPTPQEGQLPGLGVVDAIENLIAELSMLRTDRRDAAAVALNPPTFYSRGMIERRHMKSGPGVWIPVTGDIREAVHQPPLRDVPGSGYQEEDRLRQDIELTSGISDAVSGGGGGTGTEGTDTATGIQLIQAASNVRMGLMARLLLLETLRPTGRQVLELNRQHQIEETEIRVENTESSDGYDFVRLAPEDWRAPLELVPEEKSNEPENHPQKMNDALTLYQSLANNPVVNQVENSKHLLTESGIRNPEKWLASQRMSPEQMILIGNIVKDTLVQGGMDEAEAEDGAEAILLQINDASGGTMPTPGGDPSQNGATETSPTEAAATG